MTPVYNFTDVKIKANDTSGQAIYFSKTQALVDATAQSGTVSKRLQARLDISGLGNTQFDVDPSENAVPEHSVRSAETLCKRFDTDQGFLNIDDASGICPQGSLITFTPPSVTLTANPTFIPAGSSSTLTWTVANANSCTASNAWSGAKDPSPGSHTQSTGPLAAGSHTYVIVCKGPGGTTAPASATVNVYNPVSCTVNPTSAAINSQVTYTALNGTGNFAGYSWNGPGSISPNTQAGGKTFVTHVVQSGVVTGVTVSDSGTPAACPPVSVIGGGGGGCTTGCGAAGGCLSTEPSPTPGNPAPSPCVRDVLFGQWQSSGVIVIKIWASHCYSGLSVSPGALSGNWIASPDDNSSYYTYTVSGFPDGGGSLTVFCSGNGTASASINVPPYPVPPPPVNQCPSPPGPGPCNPPPPPNCGIGGFWNGSSCQCNVGWSGSPPNCKPNNPGCKPPPPCPAYNNQPAFRTIAYYTPLTKLETDWI
jgi:hypothetical protein